MPKKKGLTKAERKRNKYESARRYYEQNKAKVTERARVHMQNYRNRARAHADIQSQNLQQETKNLRERRQAALRGSRMLAKWSRPGAKDISTEASSEVDDVMTDQLAYSEEEEIAIEEQELASPERKSAGFDDLPPSDPWTDSDDDKEVLDSDFGQSIVQSTSSRFDDLPPSDPPTDEEDRELPEPPEFTVEELIGIYGQPFEPSPLQCRCLLHPMAE